MYYSTDSIDRRIRELEERAYYHANFGSSHYESECYAELQDLYAERDRLDRMQKEAEEKAKESKK